jgi:hypothetical protein
MLRRAVAPAALLLGPALFACGASDGGSGGNQTATEEPGPAPQALSSHPDPIATLHLANDHLVEVYDFGNRALVMENAKAETGPVLPEYRDLIKSGHVAELFAKLRPDLPVPLALREAEVRFVDSAASATSSSVAQVLVPEAPTPTLETSGGRGGPGKFQPLDCGSNCCNDSWLRGTMCSFDLPQQHHWFLENYGWSNQWSINPRHWDGSVCAATGTSTWNLFLNGVGQQYWTWYVAQGNYQDRWWSTCGNCGPITDEQTEVNTQANQALHTYCGSIW